MAITTLPVVALKPVVGDHEYVGLLLDAVKVVEFPTQMLELFTLNTGKVFTVTTTDAVEEQLLEVPVTTYVVVFTGLAITMVNVVELNPVDGVQLYELAPLTFSIAESP